jgi:hypothetical protein
LCPLLNKIFSPVSQQLCQSPEVYLPWQAKHKRC